MDHHLWTTTTTICTQMVDSLSSCTCMHALRQVPARGTMHICSVMLQRCSTVLTRQRRPITIQEPLDEGIPCHVFRLGQGQYSIYTYKS